MKFSRLCKPLLTVAVILAILVQGSALGAAAQSDEVGVRYASLGGQLSPGWAMTIQFTVVNQTGEDIIVRGLSFDDVLDSTADNLNLCPRVWFGDAGYSDRPQGEDEENPPANPYPLQQPQMESSVLLGPGEEFALQPIDLYMIQAAPNECRGRILSLVTTVNWEFVQTYGTVSGTITDVETGLPISSATAIITGTTDNDVVTEEVAVNADGEYVGTYSYHTGTEVTVQAIADGYTSNSTGTNVVEGVNTVNLALEPQPDPVGTVSGSVVDDETGEPIPGASVVISGTNTDGDEITETVVADELGDFAGTTHFMTGTPVSVNASANGYEPATQVVENVVEGANTVSLRLAPIQEEPIETPTETPDGTPVETPTQTPADDSDDQIDVTPTEKVTELPSTGSGSPSHAGAIVSAAALLAGVLAAGIRRVRS